MGRDEGLHCPHVGVVTLACDFVRLTDYPTITKLRDICEPDLLG